MSSVRVPQHKEPLASSTICAKFVTVVLGSEVIVNPSCGAGLKGGFVGGVVVVTSTGLTHFLSMSPGRSIRCRTTSSH